MRILQVHNYYDVSGGEDVVVESEKLLLESKGHEVLTFYKNNNDIKNVFKKIQIALSVHFSKKSFTEFTHVLEKFLPDVVHVHNFFPKITPSVYDVCINANVPVVQTLHNYRTICPTSLLMLNGKPCELSLYETAFWAVPYKVYRNSLIGTVILANMIEYHKRNKTWNNKVERFICLTHFSKRKFIEAGFFKKKITVKSNFSLDLGYKVDQEKKDFALFIGRLSEEKGIDVILEAWKKINFPLKIIGEGNNFTSTVKLVELLGHLPHKKVMDNLKSCLFIVIPSICYEGFPLAVVEAFSCGVPVICSRIGSLEEIIENGITGLHFEAGNADDLAEKIQWMHSHPDECAQMGLNARKVYEQKYTPEKNYEILMDIYQQAIKDSQNSVVGNI